MANPWSREEGSLMRESSGSSEVRLEGGTAVAI